MSRVYVGRLPPRCSERDIERFFKGYGRLRDVVLKNGYGFVEFDSDRDADDAVVDLHGRDLRGERIIVEHARLPPGSRGGSRRSNFGDRGGSDRGGSNRDRLRYGPPTRTDYRVLVENLSSRVSWQDLKDLMRKAGDVTYADAHKSQKNDGIVEFSSHADMKDAIERFDNYELYGRRLKVYEDRPSRRSSGSRRSRSVSRRRSKSRSIRKRSASSGSRRGSRRSSDASPRGRSRSPSRRSVSHHSAAGSDVRKSRSPSRNGRVADKNGAARHSRSRSPTASRSRSRSVLSRSPAHSRSRSASRSRHSASASPRRGSDDNMDGDRVEKRTGNESE